MESAKNYFDYLEFPPELCAKPLSLVGLTGLDTLNNAIHRTIWDAFSNNGRVDRAPVQFKLFDSAHEFPPVKPRRSSYEWYIPKGILKRNWMNKHLNEVPAVIVIFYELDWDDQFWNEKKIECSSRVQSVKAALEGRSTRIAVVLIQQTVSLPTGEDVLAAERAGALCTSCEINPKSLFVLPHGDHLHGYTLRLENAFYDLAQNYYHHETRCVKSHRDHLNKTTHQYLFVRHAFKMGFLNELKQDNHTAHKHYTQAYNNLLELRIVDTNLLEVKVVAGFINYKLCKLMFLLTLPRDAIAQFRKHCDTFRNRIGNNDLIFEHYAWMSKQFSAFGDIFDEAIRQGLPALQTQHPGFYFQLAAHFASERKKSCEELCKEMTYPADDPLTGMDHLEFYGQRAWRPGKLSAEPPDPAKERLAIQALQYKEKKCVNHSMMIIGLLGSAITQFNTYRCPRTRRHLVVQMAEEYYSSRDYSKALTLLSHMLWDYRSEKWWLLVTKILTSCLACAYLSASVQDYIVLSLEALGSAVKLPIEEKTRIFTNLQKVLKRTIPDPEPNVDNEGLLAAKHLWSTVCVVEPISIAIDMNNIAACVESKARFTKDRYQSDENVEIEIFVKYCCPHPLQFSKLYVTVNNPSYSSEFLVYDSQGTDHSEKNELFFNSGDVKKYVCRFLPDIKHIGKEIQIGSVLLHLGSGDERIAILRFTGTGGEPGVGNSVCSELQHFRIPHIGVTIDFDNIKPLPATEIIPRDSKVNMEVEHEAPALIGELFTMKVKVHNMEEQVVSNVSLEINLHTSTEDPNLEQATQLCENPNEPTSSLPMKLTVGNLERNALVVKQFYMRAHHIGSRTITVKISYTLLLDRNGQFIETESWKQEMITVNVVKPFDISVKFFSLKFEPITKAFLKEPFIIMPHVTCISSVPLVIVNSSVELSDNVKTVDEEVESQLCNLCLKNSDVGTEAYCLIANEASESQVAVGLYTLQWRRQGSEELIASSSVTMPAIKVENIPLYIEMVVPAHGWVRTPMAVSYHIRNHTPRLLDMDLNMEASDAFMFAGHKQLQVRILPQAVKVLDYNLYPLLSGLVALPRLRLTVSEAPDAIVKPTQLTELLDRCLPSHVYVMPQGKGNPTSSPVLS